MQNGSRIMPYIFTSIAAELYSTIWYIITMMEKMIIHRKYANKSDTLYEKQGSWSCMLPKIWVTLSVYIHMHEYHKKWL